MIDKPDRDHSQAILVKRATAVFGDEEFARDWLSTPKRALGGEIPIELVSTEQGIEDVDNLLGRIEHGVFS